MSFDTHHPPLRITNQPQMGVTVLAMPEPEPQPLPVARTRVVATLDDVCAELVHIQRELFLLRRDLYERSLAGRWERVSVWLLDSRDWCARYLQSLRRRFPRS